MKPSARADHFSQTVDIALAFTVIEDVKESAIERGVELLTEINELEGISHDEARLYSSFGRLLLGQLDCPRRHVDPYCFATECGGHDGVFTGATTDVEDPADEHSIRSQLIERGLRASDVPSRGACRIEGIEVVSRTGHGIHAARDRPGLPPV